MPRRCQTTASPFNGMSARRFWLGKITTTKVRSISARRRWTCFTKIGDGVPAAIEFGYHLCYGSPADEHMVQPKDMGIMVELTNAVVARVRRPIQFFHMPVPKGAPTTAISRR